MYLILKNIVLYNSSFLEYDRKYKKRQKKCTHNLILDQFKL